MLIVCLNLSVADVGQEEDFEAARVKALKVGASKFVLKVRIIPLPPLSFRSMRD